jgi:hypothetical protein
MMWLWLFVFSAITITPPPPQPPGFGDPDGCPARYLYARYPGDPCSYYNWGHSEGRQGKRP